ncbi:exonuclease SbcCD subunit D [Ilumatobacter sp.]|uniref:metallophosphoesterase family protein n=1 Tax=Ilumatobacter sp. TaxID=1967498 RepID=UPI0037501A2D
MPWPPKHEHDGETRRGHGGGTDRATRRATENLIQAALDHEVSLVVLAGDIFDGDWPGYGTGLFWNEQLGRLHEAGIPVVSVAGNHDAQSQISRNLQLPPNGPPPSPRPSPSTNSR